MALLRRDPFSDLRSIHSQVDDMFNQMFSGLQTAQIGATTDVYTEDDKAMIIEAQLSGFAENEVQLEVHQGVLEIRAEHHEKEEDKKRKYLVRESSSSVYRRIALPERAHADGIKAEFKHGLLKITVPFKELPSPKRIAIEGGKK